MNKDIKKMGIFAPKWWNPLFWAAVVLAPVAGLVTGSLVGSIGGLLIGYEKGLETAGSMLHKITVKLP